MSDHPTIPASLLEGSDAYQASTQRNIENFIGVTRVPVGLAGPLDLHGDGFDDTVHVPLATTEGTLVASTCRGMKVLRASGGAQTRVVREGVIQRAPVFECIDIESATALARSLEPELPMLASCVTETTKHGRLVDARSFQVGRHVHLRLSLRTGDAAGQNMVSVAAARCVETIMARHGAGVRRVMLEGGFSGEKVPSNLNMLFGRGWAVVASARIPGDVLFQHTRATPRALEELLQVYGNAALQSGQGNSHASLINILPAIYIATGQDVASVPESCMAQNAISYRADTDTLCWEVHCPNLVLATVGGGTALPTQADALALMGCLGTGRAARLAQICAATALANEISFWSAICAHEWVAAHAKVRRDGLGARGA